ncbi:hypothetical protein ACO0E1_07315 [Curtobacterium sp. RRHDQ66]|uniref:hypothetical protein n=1 Tax=Curtobacterium guangdongense TaxID=3413380 RepID=UPI003BF1FF9C
MTSTEVRPTPTLKADDAKRRGHRDRASDHAAAVGLEPRVDLLPQEVRADRRERGIARRAWFGVVVAGAVVVLGTGAAVAHQLGTAAELASAQAETSTLLAQQQRFADVRTAEQQTQLLQAGQAVGGASEIDWHDTLSEVERVLPDGVEISAMRIASADSVEPFSQSTAALSKSRVATVSITVKSSEIPSVSDWNGRLSSLRGYVGSTISSISYEKETARYSSVIDIELNDKAYDGKYTKDADR